MGKKKKIAPTENNNPQMPTSNRDSSSACPSSTTIRTSGLKDNPAICAVNKFKKKKFKKRKKKASPKVEDPSSQSNEIPEHLKSYPNIENIKKFNPNFYDLLVSGLIKPKLKKKDEEAPLPVKNCFRCKQPGHIAAECPTKKAPGFHPPVSEGPPKKIEQINKAPSTITVVPVVKKTPELTPAVAIDCEMVGVGDGGRNSNLARVSLVNQFNECLYDKYVKPIEEVTDYRTAVSGIRPEHLANAEGFKEVQAEVAKIIDRRILVGHSLKHDLQCLFLSHPKFKIRDTATYKPFRALFNGQTPSLKKLSEKVLGISIQGGEHNSVEDARAAMSLYCRVRKEWERSLKFKSQKRKMEHQKQESVK